MTICLNRLRKLIERKGLDIFPPFLGIEILGEWAVYLPPEIMIYSPTDPNPRWTLFDLKYLLERNFSAFNPFKNSVAQFLEIDLSWP
jgi:hypothetical protein